MQDFTDVRYVDLKKGKFNTLTVDSTRQSFLPYLVPYSATPCQDVPPITLSKSMKEQLEEQLRGWNARNDKLAMLSLFVGESNNNDNHNNNNNKQAPNCTEGLQSK